MRDKRLLIIAFHFPPLQLSSGLHRTLSLVRYLPAHGWDVSVLTARPGVYRRTHADNVSLIPEGTRVIRTPAFDTSRHLAIKGWYPRFLAKPDNYQSWIASAVPAGLLHCRKHRPDVILSTYPIASAHYIGRMLARATGIPWVADFRDPMAQDDHPPDVRLRRYLHRLERGIVDTARRIFVTTPGTSRIYSERYPELHDTTLKIVPNGYEETLFQGVPESARPTTGRTTLLHSGSLYRNERDPTCFFEALARIRNARPALMQDVRVMLRGTRFTEYFREIVERLDIGAIVTFGDPVTYQDAVTEMQSADALLVLQAGNCNEQIPAKVYEYMYASKPIIALTDPEGDTARLLEACGVRSVARLDDVDSIAAVLERFLDGNRNECRVSENFDVERFSRKRIASEVSDILTEIAT